MSEAEKTEICLGAILTQNTAWPNASKALSGLGRSRVRSLAAVLRLPSRRLESCIRSAGYFRQKARKLKAFAGHVLSVAGGGPNPLTRYLAGELPGLRHKLLSVWGIGPETADSILLYAGGRPIFVIDAYTLRILKRLSLLRKESYPVAQELLALGLPPPLRTTEVFNEFHALLVEHAKRHCKVRPLCSGCPLFAVCRYGRDGKK